MRNLQSLVCGALFLTSFMASAQNENSSSFWIWNSASGLQADHQCLPTTTQASRLPTFYSNLRDQAVEIKDLPSNIQEDSFPFTVVGSLWQTLSRNGSFATARCADQDYVLFDVSAAGFSLPIARIAVPFQDTSLFQAAGVQSVDDVEAHMVHIAVDVESTEGSVDYVVCTAGSSTNVRDQSLTNVLFSANRFESLKMVQSFGTDRQKKTINGVVYYFQKVQFPNRSSDKNTGWMADNFIKLRSQCVGAPGATNPGTPTTPTPPPTASAWTFPTAKRATANYKTGMRAYGASRSGGVRLHAAADLYRVHGDPALAVTGGKVIRDKYYFYEGTYAIEIQHTDGKVVRYGEITGTTAPNIALGKTVQTGQTVGYIGTVNSGCCSPMLHFEMYAGTKTGALTQSGNKYNRRSDLMNPNSLLTTWEKEKFGTSY